MCCATDAVLDRHFWLSSIGYCDCYPMRVWLESVMKRCENCYLGRRNSWSCLHGNNNNNDNNKRKANRFRAFTERKEALRISLILHGQGGCLLCTAVEISCVDKHRVEERRVMQVKACQWIISGFGDQKTVRIGADLCVLWSPQWN